MITWSSLFSRNSLNNRNIHVTFQLSELPLLHLANELSKWFIHSRIRENRLFIESIDLSTMNFVKSWFSTKVNLEQSVFSLGKLAKTRSWLGQNCDNQSLHRSRNIRFPSVLRNHFSDRRLLEIVNGGGRDEANRASIIQREKRVIPF